MNNPPATLPIACTLSPGDAAARARRWRALIARHTPEVSRTARCVEARWRLDGDDTAELDALVASERECCAFATWTIEHHGTDTTLRICRERLRHHRRAVHRPHRASGTAAVARPKRWAADTGEWVCPCFEDFDERLVVGCSGWLVRPLSQLTTIPVGLAHDGVSRRAGRSHGRREILSCRQRRPRRCPRRPRSARACRP